MSVLRPMFGLCLLLVVFGVSEAMAASTISGTVYDRGRVALPEIDVELLNDYHQVRGRTKTDGAGRYQFNNLPNGRYEVRVFAFRYDLEDQTLPIEVDTVNIRGGEGVGFFLLDFYLQPRKGGIREAELSVVFAQDVPKEAEDAYKKALSSYSKNRPDEGFVGLQQALTVFPTYYAALLRYGQELAKKKQYTAAVQIFMTAAEVNPKGPMPYYYAGSALYNIGEPQYKNAIITLNEALQRAPNAVPVLVQLATVERRMGKLTDAETHLLKAKKVSATKLPELQSELWQLYNDLKQYAKAADELETLVKISKFTDEGEAQAKKQIAELRAKAKTQTSN